MSGLSRTVDDAVAAIWFLSKTFCSPLSVTDVTCNVKKKEKEKKRCHRYTTYPQEEYPEEFLVFASPPPRSSAFFRTLLLRKRMYYNLHFGILYFSVVNRYTNSSLLVWTDESNLTITVKTLLVV